LHLISIPTLQTHVPYNLTILMGEFNVAVTREFAEFATSSNISFELLSFLQTMLFPEEHYYSTLASITSYNFEVKLC
jgi:hypothetical protein